MTWIKLDDSFPDHPKVAGLSDKEFRMHISAMCFAGKFLTDGHIPAKILPKLGIKNFHKIPQKLIEKGLWIKVPGGYQIHDYLKHQTSKAQAEREKEGNRMRAQKAREAKIAYIEAQNNAKNNAVISPVTAPEVTVTDTPTDSPTPTDIFKRLVQTSFEQFWKIYPRRDGKKAARVAIEKALKKTSIEEILEGVDRYKKFLATSTQQFAMPATWLNGERWNDEPLPKSNVVRFPQTVNVPHAQILDANTQEPYCQSCGQTWPCVTESKKSEAKF